MSCYHPLKGYLVGITESGKRDLLVRSYQTDHVELIGSIWEDSYNSDFVSKRAKRVVRDFVPIPCGKCIGCRLDHSRQWAVRLMLELEYSCSGYFVTLTYDDDNIRLVHDNVNGHLHGTLLKRDLQLFMKRLRKKFGNGIRFYASGEYGSATFRPHYHLALFNLPELNLIFFKKSPLGQFYYLSPDISECWNLGHVLVGELNFNSSSYISRYVTKKLDGELDIYSPLGIVPPFSLMSRKPGIARQYYDDHYSDIYDTDTIYLSTPKGGRKLKPPRYFDKLLENDDPVLFNSVRENRLISYESYVSTLNNIFIE